MEELGALMHGFAVVLTPMNIALMFVGIILGVLIGVLPGLGGANGVAILLPLTYTGSFVHSPVVERLRARTVEVEGADLFLMGDGEEMGEVPATVECSPGVLRLIVG